MTKAPAREVAPHRALCSWKGLITILSTHDGREIHHSHPAEVPSRSVSFSCDADNRGQQCGFQGLQ
jgi:hypothetical protein